MARGTPLHEHPNPTFTQNPNPTIAVLVAIPRRDGGYRGRHRLPHLQQQPHRRGHDVPYTEIGVYRSSLNLLSAAVEDEGGNLDSTNGEGNEIANNMSHLHGGGEG
jgi:hypothetical protein